LKQNSFKLSFESRIVSVISRTWCGRLFHAEGPA